MTALLIIDVQEGLFSPEPNPADADAVIARINLLADRARSHGAPVIFIQHERHGTAVEFGSAGWRLDRRLQASEHDIMVRKTTPDAFLRTDLQQILAEASVDHVAVCGYASEFCVDTTVRRSAALGFAVTIVSDAHTTHDKPHMSAAMIRAHHNATLPDITSFGPKITALPAACLWPTP